MKREKTNTEGRMEPWSRTIFGSPQSKANSRRLVSVGGSPRFIKGKAALAYLNDFNKQCPTLEQLFTSDICVEMNIYYSSRRPDLDESLILDALQGKVIANDRSVRKKIISGYVDPANPRVEIRITPIP